MTWHGKICLPDDFYFFIRYAPQAPQSVVSLPAPPSLGVVSMGSCQILMAHSNESRLFGIPSILDVLIKIFLSNHHLKECVQVLRQVYIKKDEISSVLIFPSTWAEDSRGKLLTGQVDALIFKLPGNNVCAGNGQVRRQILLERVWRGSIVARRLHEWGGCLAGRRRSELCV